MRKEFEDDGVFEFYGAVFNRLKANVCIIMCFCFRLCYRDNCPFVGKRPNKMTVDQDSI